MKREPITQADVDGMFNSSTEFLLLLIISILIGLPFAFDIIFATLAFVCARGAVKGEQDMIQRGITPSDYYK